MNMAKLIECVPNFSVGKDKQVLDAIVQSMEMAGSISLLDSRMDPSHNRAVVTFVGEPEECFKAAFAGCKKAAELIDMDKHEGEHQRFGATDVIPFIPLQETTLDECTALARRLGEKIGKELDIPVYLYGEAALRTDRKVLQKYRKPSFQYEELKEAIGEDQAYEPDFGPSKLPKAGATNIGAREFLIAYNIYLSTDDIEIAKNISREIRESGGGLQGIQAGAMRIKEANCVQVSMNIVNYKVTPIHQVLEMTRREAARYGVMVTKTEVYGMLPQEALIQGAKYYIQLNDFDDMQIIEKKIAQVEETGENRLINLKMTSFLNELASDSPAPGGGSAACLTAAMGAALGSMVSNLTIGKEKYKDVEDFFKEKVQKTEKLRKKLTNLVYKDANAFSGVIQAFKMPKETEEQKAARSAKIQEEYKHAADVPMETCRTCREVIDLLEEMGTKGNAHALSDVAVGALCALTGLKSAALNVKINIPAIKDEAYVEETKKELNELLEGAEEKVNKLVEEIEKTF